MMTKEEEQAIKRWHVVHLHAVLASRVVALTGSQHEMHNMLELMFEEGISFALAHPWEARQMLTLKDRGQDPEAIQARDDVIESMYDVEDLDVEITDGHNDAMN